MKPPNANVFTCLIIAVVYYMTKRFPLLFFGTSVSVLSF